MDPSSVLQVPVQMLANRATREICQVWDVDKEFNELQDTYKTIQALLDRWDGWQINDSSLKKRLIELEGYYYDAEDLIDEVVLSCLNEEEDQELQGKHPFRRLILKSCSIGKWKISSKIVKLRDDLKYLRDQIETLLAAGANNLKHSPIVEPSACYIDRRFHETSRDQDKHDIILELTSLQCDPSGVSIIGMDGLGKTALAQTIKDDQSIKIHFPLVLFACVSGDFELRDIVQKLFQDYSRQTWPQSHPQTAESYEDLTLRQLFCSKKSLIILDDLWDVTDKDWEDFTEHHLISSSGCKILITTRNPKVAEVTKSKAYYLNRMTDEDCKALIIRKADLNGFELRSWGSDIESIAKKCKGMPIVANKLGVSLSKNERRETFRRFKMYDLWELEEFVEVLPSLGLNKPKLPLAVKRCFAYCSLYPPNHEFNKDDLIQLWEVEGFVQPEQKKSSQRTGSECFNGLLSRSLLQPLRSADNNQTIYKMHEFSHKFAQASKTFRRIDKDISSDLPSYIRHLSLSCRNTDETLFKKIRKCKGLRTFLLVHQNKAKGRNKYDTFLKKKESLEKHKSLRLLDLSNSDIRKLPDSLHLLKHLRYLDLSDTDIERLPESIRLLRTLQILKLENCSQLDQLPKALSQLTSLTHLHVNMKHLTCPPYNMGMLTNLKTLSSYSVRKDTGRRVEELKNMKHLREICITWLENVKNKEEAQEAFLIEKPSLKRLVLEWDGRMSDVVNAEYVLEGLQPCSDLQDLVVRTYSGQQFPTWLTSLSCKLESICLDNCPNCQVLPSLGRLPLLKTLVIGSIHNVEVVDDQFCGQGGTAFPCLESLKFHDMKGLAKWTGLEAGAMPSLCTLKIVECPSLSTLPPLNHLGCLLRFEISQCPVLQSLPKLPLSLNGKSGELIITQCALVKERCQFGGDDWPKIKELPCVKIDSTQKPTGSSISPPETIKGNEYVEYHVQTIVEKATELFSRLRVSFPVGFWIVVLALLPLPGFIRLLIASSK